MVEITQTSQQTLADKIKEMTYQGVLETRSEIGFLDLGLNGIDDPEPQEKVILTSYPRCGNTMMRALLEQLSRVYTGSDCDLRRPMNQQLKDMGLRGEGLYDDSVWIVKTHFPERIGRRRFSANKCILIVRNPLDAFYSLFNMIQTSSHNESIDITLLERALKSKIWEDFIQQETTVYRDFHDYWLRETKIETYFVTYEELLEQPQQCLEGVFRFLLNLTSLEGLSIKSAIEELCQQSKQSGGLKTAYKPRSGKVNANSDFFSQAQLDAIYSVNSHHIDLFGYHQYFDKVSQHLKIKPSEQKLALLNSEMAARAIEASKAPNYVRTHRLLVNNAPDLIRPQTEKDPQRRG